MPCPKNPHTNGLLAPNPTYLNVHQAIAFLCVSPIRQVLTNRGFEAYPIIGHHVRAKSYVISKTVHAELERVGFLVPHYAWTDGYTARIDCVLPEKYELTRVQALLGALA